MFRVGARRVTLPPAVVMDAFTEALVPAVSTTFNGAEVAVIDPPVASVMPFTACRVSVPPAVLAIGPLTVMLPGELSKVVPPTLSVPAVC